MLSAVDPVAAYNEIAPVYARVSEQRRAYLAAVERLVIAGVRAGSRSMLDVGAGDGSRAGRIAEAADLCELVLLEPGERMRSYCPAHATVWAMRAEDLRARQESFDVITCLWNVLGHIHPSGARAEVLRQCARLVSPQGRVFIDVNHRYNARHYGVIPTAARFLRDCFAPAGSNGDVRVAWDIDGHRAATTGHVFTDREMSEMMRSAGLGIEARFVIDYATGQIRRHGYEGHFLYVCRRAAATD